MAFYENFIALCNSIHKSPTATIEEIGLERSSGTRWKRGGLPSDATARRIADYFGVTVDALLGEGSPQTPPADTVTEEFARVFAQLSPKDQAELGAEILRRLRKK